MEKTKRAIVKSAKTEFTIIGFDKARNDLIQTPTPKEFIKTRPGKGGKQFSYVEIGYVLARLNQIFSSAGWEFEVIEQIIDPKEVVVKGKLTIKDYKTGYQVSKSQYGVKERRETGVTLGDTLKAASSDCLKKCASMFGIALDVYWNQLDSLGTEGKIETPKKPKAELTSEQAYKMTYSAIQKQTDTTILREWRNKIGTSELYSDLQVAALLEKIDEKLCQ